MSLILFCAAIFLAAVAVCVAAKRSGAAYEERFPPISDAEFLARCKPGIDP